jgi:hypothetical protein
MTNFYNAKTGEWVVGPYRASTMYDRCKTREQKITQRVMRAFEKADDLGYVIDDATIEHLAPLIIGKLLDVTL